MLKSIVNGVEHDIISIPMKGKNLLNIANLSNVRWATQYPLLLNAINSLPNGVYTMSISYELTSRNDTTDSSVCGWYIAKDSSVLSNIRERWDTAPIGTVKTVSSTFTIHDGNRGSFNALYLYGCGINTVGPTGNANATNIMLNLGSTALPYEPYGYQNGWEIRDNQNNIIWGREDTITGIPPFYLRTYGLPINTWELYGNSSQSTTPTPDNPVMPEFVGVRTAQLIDIGAWLTSKNITYTKDGGEYTFNSSSSLYNEPLYFSSDNVVVSLSGLIESITASSGRIRLIKNDGTNATQSGIGDQFTKQENVLASGIKITVSTGGTLKVKNLMLNLGSTALPYEPFGYKIPFNNHGENLLDAEIIENGKDIDNNGNIITQSTRIATVQPIDITKIDSAVLSYTSDNPINFVYAVLNNGTLVRRVGNNTTGSTIDLQGGNELYLCWYYLGTVTKDDISDIMLNSGNTAKPYSPYFNETTPVYLGQTQTVRRIKKMVLTGQEAWIIWNGNYFSSVIDREGLINDIVCSHFINSSSAGISYGRNDSSGLKIAAVAVPFVSNVNELKQWLADEYAAGTPVTVWYVPKEPKTAIVNEPLAKIGNYVDELNSTNAEISIQTTYGINTLDVNTDLKPSYLSLTGHIKIWYILKDVDGYILKDVDGYILNVKE